MKALSFPPRHAAIALTASLLLLPLLTGQSAPKRIDWAGDLRFLEAELPKAHVDAFHSLKRDQFHRMVSDLIASAPHSTDRQVVAGLMRITSAIGDSHSGIHSIPANLRFAIVPISVYLFGDQLGIVAGAPYCQDLIGGKIISINGHPVKEVVQHMKLLTEGTNDMTRSAFVVTRLIRPELLFYEGFGRTAGPIRPRCRKGRKNHRPQLDGSRTRARRLADHGRPFNQSVTTTGF
jgi:hypothetical protein